MPVVSGAPRRKEIKRPARRVPRIKLPRARTPPRTTRGPRGLVKAPEQTDAPGTKPEWFFGTEAEWRVYWWLTTKARLVAGVEFEFQSSLFGGRPILGGLVADFLLPHRFPPGLVINVQGEAWHIYTGEQRAKDLLDKIRLMGNEDFTVVYVLEDDLYRSLDGTMKRALMGQQNYEGVV